MTDLPIHPETFYDPDRLPPFIEGEDRRQLLQLFLDSSLETLKKLQTDLNTKPRKNDSLKHDLHGLKGSAVSVGAVELAKSAKAMELSLSEWSDEEVFQALIGLESILQTTQIAMQPWLM